MRSNNIVLGSICILLGELCFVSMGSLVKLLAETMPSQNLVFFRNLFGLMALSPILVKIGANSVKTKVLHLHIVRSLAGILAMYCFFYALAKLSLADAMLLKISAPLFIPIFAFIWISEFISTRTILAVLVGFLGVILVLRPTGEIQFASLIGLLGGALAAYAKVSIRRMSDTEPTSRIVFYFATISLIVSFIPLLSSWVTPTKNEWLMLLALGVVGTMGQLFLTRAYTLAPASRVGPFTYSSIVFASLIGWWFWNEIMTLFTIAGASLIIFAGMLIFREKHQHQFNTKSTLPEGVS